MAASIICKRPKKLNHIRGKGKKSASGWTGFAGRSLWDWLQFFGVLAIPIIVAAGTLYFTQQITLQQAQFTQQQAKLSIAANEQQHQTDLKIAEDQQRETTLKTYLDDMSDLLLNHSLSKSKPGDVVSEVARERTLTVLGRLDANRNRIVLQFLVDAHLIYPKTIIDFSYADLSNDDLRGADFSSTSLIGTNFADANLSGAYFAGVNLSGAYFNEDGKSFPANLSGADLQEVNLKEADLRGADLRGAQLAYADLSNADLQNAVLYNAYLERVNFSNTNLKQQQLDEVFTCREAIVPNGLTCHHNQQE